MSRPFDGSTKWWIEELRILAQIVHQGHTGEGGTWKTCGMSSCTRFRDVIAEAQQPRKDVKAIDDILLAQIGLEDCVRDEAEAVGVSPVGFKPWVELDTESMKSLTTFAAAVRKAVEMDIEKENAKRFAKAVERAFAQMTIRTTEETAAWYTLRDWLKEQKETKA